MDADATALLLASFAFIASMVFLIAVPSQPRTLSNTAAGVDGQGEPPVPQPSPLIGPPKDWQR